MSMEDEREQRAEESAFLAAQRLSERLEQDFRRYPRAIPQEDGT